jgi:peptidoglycan hydrolase-like protein with peptidoglycan-binding domain
VALPTLAAQLKARTTESGIERIDALFKAAGAAAITATDPDRTAIGAVQDLLTGLGFAGLPNLFSSGYGIFGQKTDEAIRTFQGRNALPASGSVDAATLQKMIASPAPDPRAVQVYLTLVLGFPFTGMHRVLSLVAQMEGVGKFAALNRNTDRAGLSFGLIQWAQKPGRLCEVLAAMSSADRDRFVETFGEGDASVADALVAYCRKPYGGVDPKTGEPTNPAFHLAAEPWLGRFRQAALIATFQQAQVHAALTAFQRSYANVRRFAPALLSERGAAFMLDVANQFGDAGAEQLYRSSSHPGMAEMDLLAAIAEATVARVEDRFKMSVRTRRDQFLETHLLSDQPFAPGA